MNCYECGTQGAVEAAVGTCVNCGAAMCAAHTRSEEQTMDQYGTMGNPVHHQSTRKLLCVTCDDALAHRPLHRVG